MARKRTGGMGRGLAAILPESPEHHQGLREIPVGLISPNPAQPRKSFEPEALARLASSVAEAGIVQPLVVRPLADGRYELIAGERRWRAAQQAGLETVPAVLRTEDEAKRLQTALIENMAREDLNPVEEARACAALVEDLQLSKTEASRRLGRSRPAISNLIRLLELPDQVLDLIEGGELSEGHGRALLAAKGQKRRLELARGAVAAGWSVRETEARARGSVGEAKARKSQPAPDPDQEAALMRAEDELERTLGHEVRVAARAEGFRVEIRFEDLDELLDLARSLHRDR